MKYLYGELDGVQVERYKKKLHSKIHWLLLYKDPEFKGRFDVDYDEYFDSLMVAINGLNKLLFYPTVIVDLLTTLESAYLETKRPELNYKMYRKLVLDAHNLVDKLNTGESHDNS